MSDERTFVMFPIRIWNLPNVTVQLIKFYEKIFQFWNRNHQCFVNNNTLKEYTGMVSDSSISDAFKYFEKHGEMKRVMKNGKRYIIPPTPELVDQTEPAEIAAGNDPVDKTLENSTNNSQGLATARGGSRYSEGGGLATARHNINNLNLNNLNKSFCLSDEKEKSKKETNTGNQKLFTGKQEPVKKQSWPKNDAPLARVENQSNAYKPLKVCPTNPVMTLAFEEAMEKVRRNLGMRKKK